MVAGGTPACTKVNKSKFLFVFTSNKIRECTNLNVYYMGESSKYLLKINIKHY